MTSPARAAPMLGGGAGERPVKPVLQVQRSASRQSLAIHFSASAITEEDEDCDAGATTLLLRRDAGAAGAAANKAEPGIRPSVSSPAVGSLQPPVPTPPALFALDGARPPVSTVRGAPAGEPPVASGAVSRASPSHALAVARPLVSLVKSLGAEAEAPASTAAPGACTASSSSLKPKKLINLVKSLSSDVQDGGDRCPPPPAPAPRAPASGGDSSRINLQLWRQLTQPRLTVSSALGSSLANGAGGDSKTAPSSPLPSPSDGRASFFRVPEVESRIEDTRRRFSEVIHDPMLLLSKIMAGEETGTGGAGAGAAASSSSRRHNAEPGATELAVMYNSPGADGTAVATGDTARCDVDDAAAASSSSSPASAGAATSAGDCARPARGARPGADGEGTRRRRARPGEASPGNAARVPATSNAEDEAPAAPAAPAVAVEAGAARDRFPLGFPEKLSLSELASRHDDDDEDFAVDADPSASSDAADPPVGAGDPDARHGKDSPESELADRDLDDEEEEGGAGAGDTERAPALPRPPAWRLAALALLVYAYQVLPLPQYACGLALGLALGFAIAVVLVWLTASPRRCYRLGPLALEGRERAGAKLDVREPEIYRGWMNELSGYDAETYHAALTRSVFVRLEGSTLRLSRPLRNLPRRALYGEARKEAHFIAQSHYDLTDSQVFLVPPGLANKRLWNQKYPICVVLASRARDPDDRPPAMLSDLSSQNAEQQQGGASAGGAAVAVVAAVEGGEEEEAAEGGGGGGGGAVGTEVAVETEARPEKVLYLFGRTGRDKEEWFRRFLRASALKRAGGGGKALTGLLAGHSRSDSQFGRLSHSRNNSLGGGSDAKGRPLAAAIAVGDDPCPSPREPGGPGRRWALDYVAYLAPFLPENAEGTGPAGTVARSPARSADSSPTHARTGGPGDAEEGGPQLAWLNAVVGRVLWDFLQEKHWADWVSGKIQKKLSKIKLPYFMNELRLTELDMGSSVPRILRTTKLSVDHQGLWVDLDVSYSGSFTMTLETKMNLTRLGKAVEAASDEGLRLKACSLADSDEESSSAGSSEEDDEPAPLAADLPGPLGDKSQTPGTEGFVGGGGRTSSKILRLVDKITKSRYFQRATENEFIKKKMEEVSNTPLMLTVSLQECQGALALNIPPPPTDRIWYGFRSPPRLELKARPKLGERTVTFTHVTEWIESKLEQEFQKILVMPNMDDLYIPVMQSAPDTRAIAPQFRASRAPAADPADTT